jgi:hypothetical protein
LSPAHHHNGTARAVNPERHSRMSLASCAARWAWSSGWQGWLIEDRSAPGERCGAPPHYGRGSRLRPGRARRCFFGLAGDRCWADGCKLLKPAAHMRSAILTMPSQWRAPSRKRWLCRVTNVATDTRHYCTAFWRMTPISGSRIFSTLCGAGGDPPRKAVSLRSCPSIVRGQAGAG